MVNILYYNITYCGLPSNDWQYRPKPTAPTTCCLNPNDSASSVSRISPKAVASFTMNAFICTFLANCLSAKVITYLNAHSEDCCKLIETEESHFEKYFLVYGKYNHLIVFN